MSGILYTTHCPFCSKAFEHTKLEDMFAGPVLPSEGVSFIRSLTKHLFERHPQNTMAFAPVGSVHEMILLKFFSERTQDPTIAERCEWIRHEIHRFTSLQVTDERIREKIRESTIPLSLESQVFALMKELRDVCEELPPFEPKQPAHMEPAKPAAVVQA